ncbi:MAG: DJ-1/PfpI family protein, partial [Pygmaiobacter sp.]
IGTRTPTSSAGVRVFADCIDEGFTLPQDAEMIVLPGGMPGTTYLMASPVVRAVLAEAKARDIYVAAICAAPWVLDANGLLDHHRATMYPTMHEQMEHGTYTGETLVVDGKIITARAAGCAVLFGLQLVTELKGHEIAAAVKHSIYPNW